MPTPDRRGRVAGTVLGSAVGDALGAPFEFGPPGVYSARFPDGRGAMCGGAGWDPGEATDDTQMAEDALAAAIDLGGDTDTVAAVTGTLAGAVYGAGAIPDRWTAALHVPLPGHGDRVLRVAELTALAGALAAGPRQG